MRRTILLAEHFRLMSLLLENREQVVFDKFTPLIAKMVPNMSQNDMSAITEADWLNQAVDMPAAPPERKARRVNVKALCHMGQAGVLNRLTDAELQARSAGIAHAVVTMIWQADPSPKKAFTTWMLTRYVSAKNPADRLALEDLDRTKGYLSLFERVKARLPAELRDINRFRSTNDLFDAIRDYRENESGEIITQTHEQAMYEQAELIYQGADYEILSPKTMEASQFFGRGTQWCTAYAPPKTNNMFDSYNKRGPLYIIRDKQSGKRWQFQLDSGPHYMDEDDRPINIYTFIAQHPKVNEIFDKYFGVTDNPLKPVASVSEARDLFCGPFDGGFRLALAEKGWNPGGLVRSHPDFFLQADADHVIQSGEGRVSIDKTRDIVVQTLEEQGFKGSIGYLTENDIYWTEDTGYTTFVGLPVLFKEEDGFGNFIEVRRWDTGSNKASGQAYFDVYGSSANANGKILDDVFTIAFGGGGMFTYQDHTFGRNNTDIDHIVDRVVMMLPDDAEFNREDSNAKLPMTASMAKRRPEWSDLKTVFAIEGPSDEVMRRALRVLDRVTYSNTPVEAEGGFETPHIEVARYKTFLEMAEELGNDTMESLAKSWDDHYDAGDSDPDISYHQDDLFAALAKDKKLLKRLCEKLTVTYADELEECGLDEVADVHDIATLMDNNYAEEVTSAMQDAVRQGNDSGAESEAHEAVVDGFKNNPFIWFVHKGNYVKEFHYDEPVVILLTFADLLKFECFTEPDDLESPENELADGKWLDQLDSPLEATEPYYGFQGYDEDVASEAFTNAIWELAPEKVDQ